MDKKKLCEELVLLFDKELDDDAKRCSYGGEYIGFTFKEVQQDIQSKEPGYDLIFDYFTDIYIYEVFNFCGCGCNGRMLQMILKVLKCFETDNITNAPFLGMQAEDKYKEAFPNHDHDDKEFMLKWLDSVGLTDHGTSVYGCWLTDKGVLLKELLEIHLENFQSL